MRPPHVSYWYSGVLRERGTSNRVPEDVRKAVSSYQAQKRRCYCKTDKRFKYYGAQGIQVQYLIREYVGWFLEQMKVFQGADPTCSRIDHSKDYCFENIRLESRSDNSKEVLARVGNPFSKRGRPVVIIYLDEPNKMTFTNSVTWAANAVNLKLTAVFYRLNANSPGDIRKKQIPYRFYWTQEYFKAVD